jgi:hypothetical protein
LASCDKVALLAPTQSTITLVINTTTLPINATAEVLATVTEAGGTPVHNGTTVTFTASVGVMEPREARTEGGVARAVFRAGTQSGTARVGAFSGAARATEVEIRVGGAAAETVRVRTEPSTVPQTGATVQVIAVVNDISGNPLPGAPVVFTADNGILGSNSGVTDSNGEARTTLHTNRQTVVRAAVAAKEGQATVTLVNLPTAALTVSPANPIAGLPVTFTVTPSSSASGSPIQHVVLEFGDGKPSANLGAITGATTVSHVYDRPGTYTASVEVLDFLGQRTGSSIQLTVQQAVVSVSLTAPSTGQVGTALSFTVSVTNSSNVPIQSVILDYGDGTSASLGLTGGTTSKTYTRAGTFNVTATATDVSGNTYRATSQVVVAPAAPLNVTLDAASGDPAVTLNCVPAVGYPKTCTTSFIGIGVRAIFTAACNTGLGAGACPAATAYVWNFGDGTTETSTSPSVDHVFRSRGEFVVNVTVQTTTGSTGSQRLTFIVTP